MIFILLDTSSYWDCVEMSQEIHFVSHRNEALCIKFSVEVL